ncbi:uncharacterized protein N7477_005127 [Penicillium maclennaniae]|uniref:uncharacterized protein n=1 Tax=Penicillium maclennaniae TaxID=1343394 RepID=UPI0025425BBE|nr:uncharacterized protein N7477_005127 [Penicillium maclennaniae]KAJ5675193.1 hypothetical protein N7477_005127 [Penicillium maclennaniae]
MIKSSMRFKLTVGAKQNSTKAHPRPALEKTYVRKLCDINGHGLGQNSGSDVKSDAQPRGNAVTVYQRRVSEANEAKPTQ